MSMNSEEGKPISSQRARRKRGVMLTASGVQRLRQAISSAEMAENDGSRYTVETLVERTGVSASTLSRLWSSNTGVDQRSLRLIFSSFGLELKAADVQQLSSSASQRLSSSPQAGVVGGVAHYPYPSGPVPLEASTYIPRPPLEENAYQEITQSGCVVRVKAPEGFGKSSLLLRLLHQAQQLAYATAQIDLQQADQATLAHPEAFLRWLSTALTLKLGLDLPSPHELNSLIGSQLSTTLFVREQVLTTLDRPLVLIIKHLDRVLGYANTAQVMLPLLRSWHEEARHDPVWRNLRLVVSYSTDAYLLLNINFSPFNVGLPLLPPPFTTEQVQALAAIYGLAWRGDEGDRLMQLTGGNPCLVHLAVYHLSQGQSTFDDLMQTASAQGGLYQSQLQRLLAFVQERPAVIAPLKALVMNPDPIPVEPLLAYQLEGVGLIRAVANGWQISCDLYRQYFYKTWLDP